MQPSSFASPALFGFVRLLLLLLFILLGFLFFSGLVLTLFQRFFHFLGGFVGLALRIDRYLCAVLAGGGNLFHGGTVKTGVVTVKAQFLLVMVHLNVSIVFDPSLVFQSGNKDGLVID